MIMKYLKSLFIVTAIFLLAACSSTSTSDVLENSSLEQSDSSYSETASHPLVDSARKQIGVVTSYDTSYYQGGYPPEDRGACTDVVAQALKDNGYDLKSKIDEDMDAHSERYPHDSDPNINFRRVRNVKIFFDSHAKSLSTCTERSCFQEGLWKAGDIVTFDQIPGSLWHIAILSNKTKNGVPLLIHNYGRGVVEDEMLLQWPAPITGHYRVLEI